MFHLTPFWMFRLQLQGSIKLRKREQELHTPRKVDENCAWSERQLLIPRTPITLGNPPTRPRAASKRTQQVSSGSMSMSESTYIRHTYPVGVETKVRVNCKKKTTLVKLLNTTVIL